MPVLRYLTFLLLLSVSLIMGCGESGTGGTGAFSSSASLTLTADKTSVAAGDNVSATVKLTSLTSAPVDGVTVTVDSIYQGTVIGSYSSNTNTSGNAVINIPMTMVSSNRTLSLIARSNGITSSGATSIAVVAPTLTTTMPTAATTMPEPAVAGGTVGVVLSGINATFKDGNGNGVPGQTIRFTLVSQSDLSGALIINGTTMAAGGFVDLAPVTDNSGVTSINVSALLVSSAAAGGVNTVGFNYILSTTYSSLTFTKQGDSSFTVTSPE